MMFDVTASLEEFMDKVDEEIADAEAEVADLITEAEAYDIPVTQYNWLPLKKRASAIRKDIARAKASAASEE